MSDKKDGKEATESAVSSRRSFMRKSAEVAALSLFGVLGLDAITDKVLERIAENQAMGKLADSAAGALKRERLDFFAEAQDPGCRCATHCDLGYYCVPDGTSLGCDEFDPDGCNADQTPYGCWERRLTCGEGFECGVVTCNEQNDKFTCPFGCEHDMGFNCFPIPHGPQ